MGKALYRTHRPKKLDEVVGQEHITTTLSRALKNGRISHAYLFVGPRGVGKTSVARILAHEINDLPYTDDSLHFDIIEIDAASNRRIDEIRDLRDKVHIAPTSAKYKVYIIDEVHMLTKEAFNALLKTLEEPPAHVIFILATTEAHKLPETIVSRTQRFTFKPVEKQKVIEHLRSIAKQEKIKISDEALQLLAEHGEGSFRDSISLLDQAGNHKDVVEIADIELLLGIPSAQAVHDLFILLASPATTAAELMSQLVGLYNQGFQATAIAKQLATYLRQVMLDPTPAMTQAKILDLLTKLLDVPTASNPERYLEIVLLESLLYTTSPEKPTPPPKNSSSPQNTQPPKPTPKSTQMKPEKSVLPEPIAKEERTIEPGETTVDTTTLDATIWPEVLNALKKQYNTLYGIIRGAQVDFEEPNKVTLTFAYVFHQKRINDPKNRKIITDIMHGLTGQAVELECHHSADIRIGTIPADTEPQTSAAFSTISNIFGGGELLES